MVFAMGSFDGTREMCTISRITQYTACRVDTAQASQFQKFLFPR